MIEQGFAALVLVVCLALLLRMTLGRARQARWDAFWWRMWHRVRRAGTAMQQGWRNASSRATARRQAADAIERARGGRSGAARTDNVIRPSRFERDGDDQTPLH
jgi:hypothetical protein